MKNIIFIVVLVFFVAECIADTRILEQLKSQAQVHHRVKKSVSKIHKPKKTVIHKPKKTVAHKKVDLKQAKPKEIITSEELDIRSGLAYLPNKDQPFTGKHETRHSNGKKYIEIKYKDGKKNGLLIMWDEYEHKIGELNFEDGNQF
ncbi:MAG: hypothetical protein QX198_10110 [Methylococcaceae bacterium]